MLYNYITTTPEGEKQSGSINAASIELAINSLQAKNFIIVSIKPADKSEGFFSRGIKFFERVRFQDVVILSRQLSTLFEAKIPVFETLNLLSNETENPSLRKNLTEIIEDVQGGMSMSQAMAKHPNAFSRFYVSMVRSGEESGKLNEVFSFLADYLERSYELSSKVKRALTYPAFIISTFIVALIVMLTFVIPKLSAILIDSNQAIPAYTRIVIGISNFFRDFGVFLLLGLIAAIIFLWRYAKTESGKTLISNFQLSLPYFGGLFKKFYVSRITDSLETSLSSGISMVRALEISSDVVGSGVYYKILTEAVQDIKAGGSLSESFLKHGEVPLIVSQMIKIGEESGRLVFTLQTLSRFYKKEVDNAVDTLVSLIEPAMIVFLGLAVGLLLVSILGPIYNLASGI